MAIPYQCPSTEEGWIREHIEHYSLKQVPIHIYWRGIQLKVNSGKSAWKTAGHARSAFVRSVGGLFHNIMTIRTGGRNWNNHTKAEFKAWVDGLVTSGELQFVPQLQTTN